MEYLGLLSYSTAAIAFLIFAIVVATHSQRSPEITFLSLAVFSSIVWASVAAYFSNKVYIGSVTLEALELVRTITWLLFLQILLLKGSQESKAHAILQSFIKVSLIVYIILITLVILYVLDPMLLISELGYQLRATSHLILCAIALFAIEQLLRHVQSDQRWAIKYFCIGLGGIFTYDFYLYADTLLLQDIDSEIWAARGFINALIVPFLIVSAIRAPQFSLKFFVSHKIVFHTTTLLAGGLYLLAMGLGGYYIKLYGGSWGEMLQVVFLFGAFSILAVLIFSGSIRASFRVFLGKHFFRYRYDYRDEWLRITERLSGQKESEELYLNALQAIADIVESPAGQLWMRREGSTTSIEQFDIATNWNLPDDKFVPISGEDSLVSFLENSFWIIDVDEYRASPAIYSGLELPDQINNIPGVWLLVPLMQQSQLIGVAVLTQARAKYSLNWEVRDILRTAGRQVAGYLALLEANIKLASAQQFEAFNRLSAFVVHDLKNVVAQLALIERNAQTHKSNPEFIDDALTTISNANQRMNRLLAQLRTPQAISNNLLAHVSLSEIVKQVIRHCQVDTPAPKMELDDPEIQVLADKDRLMSVIEHLVQNAQDATKNDGFVKIRLYANEEQALIEIEDSGCGMDGDFIKNKLFKPFVTTKGNAGMGIGVYEAREVIRSIGGTIDVESEPGKGTIFHLSVPILKK